MTNNSNQKRGDLLYASKRYIDLIYSSLPNLDPESILGPNERISRSKKYLLIVREIPFLRRIMPEKSLIGKQLDELETLSSVLSDNGYLCILMPKNVLLLDSWKEFRDRMINNFSLAGIITVSEILSDVKIPVSIVILTKRDIKPLFAVVLNTEELKNTISYLISNRSSKKPSYIFFPRKVESNRLDPEYCHPKYAMIEHELEKHDTRRLEEVAEITVGAKVSSKFYSSSGIWKLIRPRDIQNGRIKQIDTYLIPDIIEEISRSAVREGDILISRIFDFSKIAVVNHNVLPAIASSNLFIVRIRSKKINPHYLFEFIRSNTGRELIEQQIERRAKGSSIKYATLRDIELVELPILTEEEMEKLGQVPKLSHAELTDLDTKIKIQITALETQEQVFNIVRESLSQAGWPDESILEECHIDDLRKEADILLQLNNKIVAAVEVKSKIEDINPILSRIKEYAEKSSIPLFFLFDLERIYLFDPNSLKPEILDKMMSPNELIKKYDLKGAGK